MRYITVLYMPGEDSVKHRKWLVIDTKPSDHARSGTVISESTGQGAAQLICDALNGLEPEQPPLPMIGAEAF